MIPPRYLREAKVQKGDSIKGSLKVHAFFDDGENKKDKEYVISESQPVLIECETDMGGWTAVNPIVKLIMTSEGYSAFTLEIKKENLNGVEIHNYLIQLDQNNQITAIKQ